MLLQPQEVEVFYILPAIRREMTLALKERGLSQKRIAGLLGVTPAAVSQYLHDKRAHTHFPKELKDEIVVACQHVEDTLSMIAATQHIITKARESKLICKIHAAHADIPQGCDACFK